MSDNALEINGLTPRHCGADRSATTSAYDSYSLPSTGSSYYRASHLRSQAGTTYKDDLYFPTMNATTYSSLRSTSTGTSSTRKRSYTLGMQASSQRRQSQTLACLETTPMHRRSDKTSRQSRLDPLFTDDGFGSFDLLKPDNTWQTSSTRSFRSTNYDVDNFQPIPEASFLGGMSGGYTPPRSSLSLTSSNPMMSTSVYGSQRPSQAGSSSSSSHRRTSAKRSSRHNGDQGIPSPLSSMLYPSPAESVHSTAVPSTEDTKGSAYLSLDDAFIRGLPASPSPYM